MKNVNLTIFFLAYLLFLPIFSFSQKTIEIETINNFKKKYHSVNQIETQTIPYSDSFILRFNELGEIYNPTFPNTRNRIHVENYWQKNQELIYIGFSVSTYRASVRLKGRTGKFYSIWKGDYCSSLLEFDVKRNGDNLEITGRIYKCFFLLKELENTNIILNYPV